MDNNTIQDLALMRYSAIAPIINGTYAGTIASFCRQAAETEFKLPDGTKKKYSPETLERWYAYYKKDGFEGLLKRPRSDEGKHRVLDDDITEQIRYLKSTYPKLPATAIHRKLLEDGTINRRKVSLSTVTRYINQYMEESHLSHNQDMRRYELPHINQVWYGDSSCGPSIRTSDGQKHKIFVIALIDDASRFIVGAQVFFNDNFVNLMGVMKSAVSKYGKPAVLCFDNGKSYRNKQMELLAARIGCTLSYCQPYTPTQKAKIERWFLTMKESWMAALNIKDFDSLESLNTSLQSYIRQYNNSPHSSLHGKSPYDRFFSEPELIRRLTQEQLDKDFLLEIERRVSPDSVISIDQTEYEVESRFAKRRITLRFAPDMSEIFVAEADGTLTPIRLLNKIENSKVKREKVRFSGGED